MTKVLKKFIPLPPNSPRFPIAAAPNGRVSPTASPKNSGRRSGSPTLFSLGSLGDSMRTLTPESQVTVELEGLLEKFLDAPEGRTSQQSKAALTGRFREAREENNIQFSLLILCTPQYFIALVNDSTENTIKIGRASCRERVCQYV